MVNSVVASDVIALFLVSVYLALECFGYQKFVENTVHTDLHDLYDLHTLNGQKKNDLQLFFELLK